MPTAPTIVQMLDDRSPQACPTTLALIRVSLNARSRVLLLAGQPLARDAARLSLPRVDRLGVPYGRPMLALPALHRRLSHYPELDLLHCWSITALAAAALVKPAVPKLLSLIQSPTRRRLAQLRRIVRHQPRRLHIITATDAIRAQLLAANLPAAMIQTVPPGLDRQQVPVADRAAVRARLKLDDHVTLVALLSDPPQAADARLAVLAAGLAGESRRTGQGDVPRTRIDPRVIITPRQTRGPQARALLRELKLTHLLIQDAALTHPWQILPACDLALAIGENAAGLALNWAILLGIPIAAENRPSVAGTLTDDQNTLLSPPDQAKRLALSIERLLGDSALAQRLTSQARQTARLHFDPAAYRQTLSSLYDHLCQPVWTVTSHQPVPSAPGA